MTPEGIIKEAMEKAGLKIAAVSRSTDIPYSHLQPALKGVLRLTVQEYLQLCRFFDLDPYAALEEA